MKRLTLRLVTEVASKLESIAKEKGLSVNALVTTMAWEFIESYQKNKN